MTMYKLLPILALVCMISPSACKKDSPAPVQKEALAIKYAKYRTAAYADNLLTKWAASLEKGEPLELLAEETVKKGKQDIRIAKVRLTDDTVAFIDEMSLAVRPVVFIAKNVPVYNRNNIASGVFAVIPAGTVGFVTEEKADWSKIDIGTIAGKQVFAKWAKDGINTDAQMVADAVALERIRNVLSETIQGDKNEALNNLRTIAGKDTPVGTIAKEELSSYETRSTDHEPETEKDSQTQ